MATYGTPARKIKKSRVFFSPGDALSYTIRTFDQDISGWTFEMDVVDRNKHGDVETILSLTEQSGLSVDDANNTVSLDLGSEDSEMMEVGDRYVGVLKATGTSEDPKRTLRVRFIPQDYQGE